MLAAALKVLLFGLIGRGLAIAFSEVCEVCLANCWLDADVHIVAEDAATADAEIEGDALGSCAECARKAARKLLKKGLWVGMLA